MADTQSSDSVYAVCLVHLVLSVVTIACTIPGNGPLNLGEVLIAPVLQWLNGALCCISIITIICAAIGNLFHIEQNLSVYQVVLALTLAVDFAWLGVFVKYGEQCKVGHGDMDHVAKVVTCAFGSGVAILCVVCIILFKIWGLWVTSKAKKAVRIKYNEELLPFLQKSLNHSLSSGRSM